MKKLLIVSSLILMLGNAMATQLAQNTNGGLPPQQVQGVQGQQSGSQDHRPPKEAVEACQSKSAGSGCSFTGREGQTMSGECFTPEQSKPLACRPNHQPSGQGQQGDSQGQRPLMQK